MLPPGPASPRATTLTGDAVTLPVKIAGVCVIPDWLIISAVTPANALSIPCDPFPTIRTDVEQQRVMLGTNCKDRRFMLPFSTFCHFMGKVTSLSLIRTRNTQGRPESAKISPIARAGLRSSSIKRLRLAILSSPKNVPLFAGNSAPNPVESLRNSSHSRAARPSFEHHFNQPGGGALRFPDATNPLPISCPVGGKLYPETVFDQVSEARDLLQQRPFIREPARSVACLRRGIFLSRLAQLLQLFERRFTSPIIHRRLVASHFRKQLMLLLAHPV